MDSNELGTALHDIGEENNVIVSGSGEVGEDRSRRGHWEYMIRNSEGEYFTKEEKWGRRKEAQRFRDQPAQPIRYVAEMIPPSKTWEKISKTNRHSRRAFEIQTRNARRALMKVYFGVNEASSEITSFVG